MFTVEKLSFHVTDQYTGEERFLLRDINWSIGPGHFAAILGPSGCGKSTLVRCLLGLNPPSSGRILLDGHDLTAYREYFVPELGYVPQFSIAHDDLTALEVLEYAAALRLSVTKKDQKAKISEVLAEVDLARAAHTRVVHLSGGQKRRLALAMELLKDPPVLIMDEVTSGLDAESERRFMELFARLAREHRKTVICVTHHVENVHLCDSVLVLEGGRRVYAGTPEGMLEFFNMETPMLLYSRLNTVTAQTGESDLPVTQTNEFKFVPPPGAFKQWLVLARRQWKLFFRNPSQVLLHAVLMLGFPLLVVVFALKGLPQVKEVSLNMTATLSMEDIRNQMTFAREKVEIATLASGLIMFQIILLTLMGSNNSASEIVKERVILEKEKLSGLSPGAYFFSKAFFVTVLSLAQAAVMLYMVKLFCQFPGDTMQQFGVLAGATMSMSFICLFFSAFFRTTEQASLVSIYLVGLQLPLSGAVLALPDWLLMATRPLIDAYWGWSAYIKTLVHSRVYDLIIQNSMESKFIDPAYAYAVFAMHILIASIAAYFGIRRRISEL